MLGGISLCYGRQFLRQLVGCRVMGIVITYSFTNRCT